MPGLFGCRVQVFELGAGPGSALALLTVEHIQMVAIPGAQG